MTMLSEHKNKWIVLALTLFGLLCISPATAQWSLGNATATSLIANTIQVTDSLRLATGDIRFRGYGRIYFHDGSYISSADTIAITGLLLAANGVDSTKLAPSCVQSTDIADGQVKTADLATDAVDSNKIADSAVSWSRLTSAVKDSIGPAGTTKSVQYNKTGHYAYDSNFTYDESTDVLSAKNVSTDSVGIVDKLIIGSSASIEMGSSGGGKVTVKAPSAAESNFTLTLPDAGTASTFVVSSDGNISSSKITNGTIVNDDVNASAAIAGTKISPDFGSQNIVTTGSGGIGTASPSVKFEVSTSGSTTGLKVTGNKTTGRVATFTNEYDGGRGDSSAYVSSTGQLMIGGDVPYLTDNVGLTVRNKEAVVEGALGSTYTTFRLHQNGVVGWSITNTATTGLMRIAPNNANSFAVNYDAANEGFRLLNGGYFGIGTISPGAKLEVNGNASIDTVAIFRNDKVGRDSLTIITSDGGLHTSGKLAADDSVKIGSASDVWARKMFWSVTGDSMGVIAYNTVKAVLDTAWLVTK